MLFTRWKQRLVDQASNLMSVKPMLMHNAFVPSTITSARHRRPRVSTFPHYSIVLRSRLHCHANTARKVTDDMQETSEQASYTQATVLAPVKADALGPD